MQKYTVLKFIFQSSKELTPIEISKRSGLSLPNIYVYLKDLSEEKVIHKTEKGEYKINKTNKKTSQLLDLQAMVPEKFNKLISRDFKKIMEKMCLKLNVERSIFSRSETRKIEEIAVPLRIVLKISRRPGVYLLKINEALVSVLLNYHDLKPNFSLLDFQELINKLNPRKPELANTAVKSDSEVAKMCDKFYETGDDQFTIKMENFITDERLNELLKTADQINKEYTLFLNALDANTRIIIQEQWEKRYIYNTNSIEGNTMSEDEISEYLKTRNEPKHVTKREIFETNNTQETILFLKIKKNEEVSEELIKELHFMIEKNIAEKPGTYKNFYNYIRPNNPTTPPQHVKTRMANLIDWYKKNNDKFHPFVLASIFHMQFEIIHPFGDGNGRVGRLVMNHILNQKNYLSVTIIEKTKQNYYRALENHSLHQFLLYTLSSFVEEYKR